MTFWLREPRQDGDGRRDFRSPFAAAAMTEKGEKSALDHVADTVSECVIGARLLSGDPDQDEAAVLEAARAVIAEYNLSAASRGLPLLALDPEEAARKVVDRILGWGPLTELMEDEAIEDIAVNGLESVWAFRAGAAGWERQAHIRIPSWDYLRNLVNRKADWRGTGRAITFTNPTVNAQLPDGSRLHGVMAPVLGRVEAKGDPRLTRIRARRVACWQRRACFVPKSCLH